MSRFSGLTWDHPRGYDSLARAAREAPHLISWDKHPLEGFESTPISDICARYDIVVLDHPHLGDALAENCLVPLERVIPAEELAAIRSRTIGPCFDSYVMNGSTWALPLDAAAQVSAARSETHGKAMPDDWEGVEKLSAVEKGFTLSLAGPHAFLSLLSICATFDERFGPVREGLLQSSHDDAISLYCLLAARSHPFGAAYNPIRILSEMAARSGPTYCPLIFGYVPYANASLANGVTFRDAPSRPDGGEPHSVLGGTGIALTRRCAPDRDLVEHLVMLLSTKAQTDLLPRNSGQPSAEAAWTSAALNRESNNFYSDTLRTLRSAFVRPRTPGFVPAQNRAAAWLREAVVSGFPSVRAIRMTINELLAK